MKKAIGAILVLLVFVAIFIAAMTTMSFAETCAVFAVSIIVAGILVFGVCLLEQND